MLRKLFAATILLAALCATPVLAQVSAFGIVGGGVLLENGGESDFAMFAGQNMPVFTDTARGYRTFNRLTYFYVDRGGEQDVQSIADWLFMQKKWRGTKLEPFVNIGTGYIVDVRDTRDGTGMAVSLELGVDVKGTLSVGLGLTHQPRAGMGDLSMISLFVDLLP